MDGHQKQKEQSRQMIEEALFALMEEKDYMKITVLEIVDRADLARRTFYRLYAHKEDVINYYLDRLCHEYQVKYAAMKSYDIRQIAAEYFSFWHQYREFLLLLHAHKLDYLLFDRVSHVAIDVVKNRICDRELKEDRELDYFVDYSAGGFLSLLHRWIRNGMKESPERYAKTVSRAVLKYFQQGTGQI